MLSHSTRMNLWKTMISLIFVIPLVTVSRGDINVPYLPWGTCICFYRDNSYIRDSGCGGNIIGKANSNECYKSTGSSVPCTLNNDRKMFYSFNWGGDRAYGGSGDLNYGSQWDCPSARHAEPGSEPAAKTLDYTCQVTDLGIRVHASGEHLCVDSGCNDTCKGGQSVSFVKCSCTAKDGTHPPDTKAWKPEEKLTTADGKCNRNITANTAIATFNSSEEYTEHAAVFIKCQDDYTIQVYDQWCGRGVGYSTYNSSHPFYDSFATIRSFSSGPNSISCRNETSGSTDCAACYSSCTNVTCST